MVGSVVSHYRVLEKLGEGGMGVVYKAEDTNLKRLAALKFLPPDMTRDPAAKERFVLEAQAASALNHAHVTTIYGIEESPEGTFIAMEYVEGKTLKQLLEAETLSIQKSLDIAIQVAEGLAAAHEKGIVHRDIKAENIMITPRNQAKIMDFGLAKLQGAEKMTQTRSTLGTLSYMSPEQAKGEDVDRRSDIFSLGVVLYEMLAGRLPFTGEYQAAVIYAIINEAPQPVARYNSHVSAVLERIVDKAMAKDREERYQHADELLADLRRERKSLEYVKTEPATIVASITKLKKKKWPLFAAAAAVAAAGLLILWLKPTTPSAQVSRPPKIVVLPFENLGAPEDAYFASGMAEEITSRLANVRGLAVISRTTAMEYDRKGKTVRQIGSDLGVDYVLEGSVRWEHRAGGENRVRITPQLIRVADDTHVWAERYERVLEEVFAIQSEVAESAVNAMGVTLLPNEQTALKEISTSDLEAYDFYLRGQKFSRASQEPRDVENALKMYQAAVDKDPSFAQALAGLAKSHLNMYWFYYDRSPDRIKKAREAAERAVKIRPNLAEAHVALGFYYYHGRLDYQRASDSFKTALRIEPSNSQALFGTGSVLRRQGYWQDSADALGKALELDSKNATLHVNFAQSCVLARRYEAADKAYGLAIALNPQWDSPYVEKAWLQIQWHGDVVKAEAILTEGGRVIGLLGNSSSYAPVIRVRRDYEEALRQYEAETSVAVDSQFTYLPLRLLCGQVRRLAGQLDASRRSFEAARLELEQRSRQDPDDHRFHSSLGIAYAELGRSQEAVKEAKLGCALMPPSKDAWRALFRLEDLAHVYTIINKPGDAIAILDELLSRSGKMTSHVLRLDPVWDRLRSDPRFKDLLRKYEVKL